MHISDFFSYSTFADVPSVSYSFPSAFREFQTSKTEALVVLVIADNENGWRSEQCGDVSVEWSHTGGSGSRAEAGGRYEYALR